MTKETTEQKALRARFLAEYQTENAWLVFEAQEQAQRALEWVTDGVRSEVVGRLDDEGAISEAVVEALARVRGELSELVLTGLRAYADTLDTPRVEAVMHACRADAERWRATDPMSLVFARPWRKVEGAQLCEAGVVVMRAADRLCPGWSERHEWLEWLIRRDGALAWLDDEIDGEPRPSLVARLLVAAAAAAWKRQSMVPATPSTQARWQAQLVQSGAQQARESKWEQVGRVPVRRRKQGDEGLVAGFPMPANGVPVITGIRGAQALTVLDIVKEPHCALASLLAVRLIWEATEQAKAGSTKSPEVVYIPTARAGLREWMGGRDTKADDVRKALNLLTMLRTGSEVWVAGWRNYRDNDDVRTRELIEVLVGPALFGWRCMQARIERGYMVADDWLSPIFDTRDTPLVGHCRREGSYDLQRAFYGLAFGDLLTRQRVAILRGGFEPARFLDAVEHFGIVDPEAVLGAYVAAGHLKRAVGADGKGMLTLGERHVAVHAFISGQGALSVQARQAALERWHGVGKDKPKRKSRAKKAEK